MTMLRVLGGLAAVLSGAVLASPADAPATTLTPVAGDLAGMAIAYDVVPSRDGQRLLIRGTGDFYDDPDLWSVDVSDGAATRVTSGGRFPHATAQSPDGGTVVWAQEPLDRPTILHRTQIGDGQASDERIAFPRVRFRSPEIDALSVSPAGRIWLLAGSGNAAVAATDGAVLTAAPGASRLTVVRDVVLRRGRPGDPAFDVEAPGGTVFGVCRAWLARGTHRTAARPWNRAGMTMTRSGDGRSVVSITARTAGGPRCVMSDGGAGLMTYPVAPRSFRGVLVTAGGRTRRVRLHEFGIPEALSPDGHTLIARRYDGSRRAAIVHLRSGRLHRIRTAGRAGGAESDSTWNADASARLTGPTSILHLGSGHTTSFTFPGGTHARVAGSLRYECFSSTGRVLASAYTSRQVPYSDAQNLLLSDPANRRMSFIPVAPELDPIWSTSACQDGPAGTNGPVYFVAGDPPQVYRAAGSDLDGSRLEVAPG